jgi:outer membrane receptor for ferrienterochelin and colicins
MKLFSSCLFILLSVAVYPQEFTISGTVTSNNEPLPFANVYMKGSDKGTVTDENGNYKISNLQPNSYTLYASFTGYNTLKKSIILTDTSIIVDFNLTENSSLDEVVITGTMKAVSRLESPVPVEVYTPTFFKRNPTSNIFEALQNVNGVRPQLNCNVCNTGDIHINGLEGPYTMVLIDGMPIVSGLSTVYGLSGIPNSLIEQVEIVKGPASSLYGSEAVGGLINIITKLPENAPIFFADAFSSSWLESNIDVGFKSKIGNNASLLVGANYYKYDNPIDNNNDNFTDVTLQDRISIFQKWNFKRKNDRKLSFVGRFFYEDRWGGEMQWNKNFRGGDEVYGESIYTKRFELLGNYQLPVKEKMMLAFSYTDHNQDSRYGDIAYLATQRIGFTQLTWDKTVKNHDLLLGSAVRYNYYDDNTTATNTADEIVIPSLFIQDEIKFNKKHTMLLGARYDYDKRHGNIFTPRLAYRYKPSKNAIIRLNAGTGFRVVNLFTEEHAALTGSRDVVIKNALKPERSYNVNLNYLKKYYTKSNIILTVDASAWYTHFTNLILPDYDTNANQIIYDNLDGFANTMGISANLDATFSNGLKILVGTTIQEVSKTEENIKTDQILTEKFTGTWSISYKFYKPNIKIDYTGNLYGPMRLPLLGELDPRSEFSPVWSIQNIQFTYDRIDNLEIYGGVKNLLNWTPNRNNPFIIARAEDPFDKDVDFDSNGNAIATANNPYALTFDPTYVYAPNQGIRGFIGLRYSLR